MGVWLFYYLIAYTLASTGFKFVEFETTAVFLHFVRFDKNNIASISFCKVKRQHRLF